MKCLISIVFKALKVINVRINPNKESQTVKKIKKSKNKSIKGWLIMIEIKLEKKTKDKYKISKKKILSMNESEEAIPNQLLKKRKIEK
jgi:hypothetical protein